MTLGYFHFLKYASFISPDLLLASCASSCLKFISIAIPLTTTRNEAGYRDTNLNHKIQYEEYKVISSTPINVYKEPLSSTILRTIEKDKIFETCAKQITEKDNERIIWIQITGSYNDGWVLLNNNIHNLKDDVFWNDMWSTTKKVYIDNEEITNDEITIEECTPIDTNNLLEYKGERTNLVALKDDGIKSNLLFRIISTGICSNGNGDLENGIYFALPGYSVPIWKPYNYMSVVDNAYHLCVFDRYTGVIEYGYAYDIFGKGENTCKRRLKHLVYDLNQLDDTKIIVIFTTGYAGLDHRKKYGLPEALMRCGASKSFTSNSFLWEDGAYVLIGIPGIGPFNGYEANIDDKQLRSVSNIDVEFTLSEGGWDVQKLKQQVLENSRVLNEKTYLKSGFANRNEEENEFWKNLRENTLPDYLSLCRKEATEINKWSNIYIGWFLSLIGIGHFITSIGRQVWKILFYKIVYFFQICFGYWTDETADLIQIHDHINKLSIVWDKPYRKKSADAYKKYRQSQIDRFKKYKKIENLEYELGLKIKKWPKFCTFTGDWLEPSNKSNGDDDGEYYQTDVMIDLQQSESIRQLSYDYSLTLHAIVSTRAVLLQLFKELTIVSIFASFMASTPIFVHSKRLRTNLPDLFVSHPFDIARIREQEEIDEQEWIRRVNLNENDYCVPNPEYKVVDGKKVFVSLNQRAKILKCKFPFY